MLIMKKTTTVQQNNQVLRNGFLLKTFFLFIVLFSFIFQMENKLYAQAASLKIQKNIVERIDRLDEYIRDTVDPNMLQNNRAAWERLKNLRDSLAILQTNMRSWGSYQDSISVVLLNQQELIATQQRMIDAINWQIKDVLRENGELKQEIGVQTNKATLLERENQNLQDKLRILAQTNDSLSDNWKVNETLLKRILALSIENQSALKKLTPDTTILKPTQTDTTSLNNDF